MLCKDLTMTGLSKVLRIQRYICENTQIKDLNRQAFMS